MDNFVDIIKNTNRIPVFLDLNNVLYRSYFVFTPDKFRSKSGLASGHLFGLCQVLRTLDKLNYEIFLCEDSNCTFRKSLNEDYKATRNAKENGTEFWRDFGKIRDLISNLPNAHTLIAEGYEADDVMYSAAKICSSLNKKCYIFSTDKDLMQALDKNISIMHKVTLTESDVIDENSEYYSSKFPVPPCKLPIYRAFKGDPSDNMEPPVKRFPKDLTIQIVDYLYSNGGQLKGFKVEKKSHEKWLKQLVENWSGFCTNYKIMKLNVIDFEVVEKSPLNSYVQICRDYDLFQFMKYMSELQIK